ncbi:unnamed protein product [Auanema sp. JU1783]|nr:unnamed protein product [Auanema sp. JU1783]
MTRSSPISLSFTLSVLTILLSINVYSVHSCSKTVNVPQQNVINNQNNKENKQKKNEVISERRPDCNENIERKIENLNEIFSSALFGQHIAVSTIPTLIQSHMENRQPRKSLVLSLYGSSGVGKTYTAMTIMKVFNTEMNNVQYFHAATLSRKSLEEQISLITSTIEKTTSKCAKSIFIFDELDLLDSKLIDSLFPYLDYQESKDSIDYRGTTFIFIGKEAGTVINDLVISHTKKKENSRESLQLIEFEKSITNAIFNAQGGFYRSLIIQNGLIDIFVPFLPLERQHIMECIKYYLETINKKHLVNNSQMIDEIADSLQYFKHIYASTGCKKVSARTDLIIRNQELKLDL